MMGVSDLEISSRIEDPAAARRLLTYVELLEKWSARHNLVRFSNRRELLRRHIFEATEGLRLLGPRGRLADIGSGAGLPGVPLLACRPQWSGVLIEPRQKRWAFLQLVIRQLELDAIVINSRFEAYEEPGKFDCITVRAVRIEDHLLNFAAQFLVPGGRLVLWSTEEEHQRLLRKKGWHVVSSPLPDLDRGLLIEMEPCFT